MGFFLNSKHFFLVQYICSMRFTLGKDKKLKSKKAIDALFENGASIRKGALRLKHQIVENSIAHKTGFSVPKRFFKLAIHRNRVKRLLRESYRLQQYGLPIIEGNHLHLMWIYQSNKLPDQEHVKQLMEGIIKQLNKSTVSNDSNKAER